MKYAFNPKNYHYRFYHVWFSMFLFVNMAFNKRASDLYCILFFFYFVVRQGNYFLLPSTQRKWPHFSNKEKRIEMKIHYSNEEHCFHIHRLLFLPFYIRHWFHYLQLHNLISHDVLNGTFLMKHKYFYITVNKHLLNCILTSIWYWY